jgi:hypothetical protein
MNSRRRVNSTVMRLYDSMIVDKPKFVSAVGAFLGSIVLIAGLYVFINRIVFLAHANSYSAPIVNISHEWVSKGKGGVLAYVPTVRVQGLDGRTLDIKVDTYNEESVYSLGQQMGVSCNFARGCIADTFFAKWGACLIDLGLSVLFFSPLLAWKSGLWQPIGDITGLHLQRDS